MRKRDAGPREAGGTPGRKASFDIEITKVDFLISGIVIALSLLVYLFTMSRSIPYIDGGELTTDLWTLGIAHPTGYPLFTMLGYLFVHIPILPEVSMRANLFAALCTSAAAGIIYLVFFRAQLVLSSRQDNHGKKEKGQKASKTSLPVQSAPDLLFVRWSSFIAALVLVFSATFWDQSSSIEVYPLQLVLFALIMLFWLGFYFHPVRSRAFSAGLVLGLGFTNHMTTLLTLPALIFLVVYRYRKESFSLKLLLYIICGGLLASLLYLYLPIRAAQGPIMDWGNPDTLKRFIWHVTGKQFRTWMFSSFTVFQHQIGVFFSSLYPEFRLSLPVALFGLVISFLKERRLFWWIILLVAGDVAYAANYNIHDISSYFLLSYIALALATAIGIRYLLERFASKRNVRILIAALLILLPGISLASNYSRVNQSDDYAVEMYTRDILTSLPHDSVVLSFQWDDWVSASFYYQHVDHLRPDIVVIDKELLRRSWYASQIHKRYSFLFPRDDQKYEAYQANLRLFENGLQYDPNSIQHTYSGFIREIISGALLDGRHVFVGPEMEDKYLYGYRKVPFGLLYELTTDTNYVSYSPEGLEGYKAAQKVHNDYSRQILDFYTRMFMARAQYEYTYRHLSRTLDWIDKVLKVDPSLQAAQNAKARLVQEFRSR